MKSKLIPIILAIFIFVAALVMLQPAPSTAVVVAAYDLPAGRMLADGDLVLMAADALYGLTPGAALFDHASWDGCVYKGLAN